MANPLDLLHHCVILHFVADHSQGEPEFCVISDQKATWLLCGIVTQKTAGSSEYWVTVENAKNYSEEDLQSWKDISPAYRLPGL